MANTQLEKLIIFFEAQRKDDVFDDLIETTEKSTGLIFKEELPAKRQKKTPKAMADFHCTVSSQADPTDNQTQHLRRIYKEACDSILASLKDRFNQEDMGMFRAVENLLMSSMNGETGRVETLDSLHTCIDLPALGKELGDLPLLLKIFNKEATCHIKKVTILATVCDVLNSRNSHKLSVPNVHKLLVLYHSVAFSSASAERSFSVMRRLKTWLRSSLTANSLNILMFSAIHTARLDAVDLKKIAEDFICVNNQRESYFGKR